MENEERDQSQLPQEAAAAPAEPAATPPKREGLQWFVVHTYSGFENKAREALKERIRISKIADQFGDVIIPQENVVEIVKGKKRTTSRKFFPGYLLVQMLMNNETWYLVKNTPKVTGFVGGTTNPPPIPDEEVARLTQQITEGSLRPRPKVSFETGDSVRVIDGPFNNFNGIVDEVKPEKGKLRVLVSIFGRSTPIELDFIQVEKN